MRGTNLRCKTRLLCRVCYREVFLTFTLIVTRAGICVTGLSSGFTRTIRSIQRSARDSEVIPFCRKEFHYYHACSHTSGVTCGALRSPRPHGAISGCLPYRRIMTVGPSSCTAYVLWQLRVMVLSQIFAKQKRARILSHGPREGIPFPRLGAGRLFYIPQIHMACCTDLKSIWKSLNGLLTPRTPPTPLSFVSEARPRAHKRRPKVEMILLRQSDPVETKVGEHNVRCALDRQSCYHGPKVRPKDFSEQLLVPYGRKTYHR